MLHWEKLTAIRDAVTVLKSAVARASACAQPI